MDHRRRLVLGAVAVLAMGCDEGEAQPRWVPPQSPDAQDPDDPSPPDPSSDPRADQPVPQGLPNPAMDPSAYQDRVTAIYLVPQGQPLVAARRDFFAQAMGVISGWYATATGGETFVYDVTVVDATHPIEWFDGSLGLNAAFGKVDTQLRELGYPVYAERTNFLVALQGEAVHYGGAMVDTKGGLELVGADSFQQVVDAGCGPGQCAINGSDGDGVTGGIAHELGHGLGLPHTMGSDVQRRWALMAEHWHFPRNGFVGAELDVIRNHPLVVGVSGGPVCGDLQCNGAEDCVACEVDCPQCNGCQWSCADYGFADGQCYQGWSCAWPCLELTNCVEPMTEPVPNPDPQCTFFCEDYAYADGQCVDGWLCTWPCIAENAC